MDDAIRGAWNWLLVDPWGISLLTVAACALVVGVLIAAGYALLGFLTLLAGVVRRLRSAPASAGEPGSTGQWRRSASG